MRIRTYRTTAFLAGLAALATGLAVPPALAVPSAHAVAGGRTAPSGDCAPGQLCLWPEADFGGERRTYELADTDIESCIRLPEGIGAASFANRTGRPVTTYQSGECAETAEFDTYPGGGTWVPQSPYRVRAFKVWER